MKIMEMLLEAGADTTVLDESQSAPLHTAVRTRDENIVKVAILTTVKPHLKNALQTPDYWRAYANNDDSGNKKISKQKI